MNAVLSWSPFSISIFKWLLFASMAEFTVLSPKESIYLYMSGDGYNSFTITAFNLLVASTESESPTLVMLDGYCGSPFDQIWFDH